MESSPYDSNKDKQRSDSNTGNATPKGKTSNISKIQVSQTIKDTQIVNSNWLNYTQVQHYTAKCQNKTAYSNTYKSKPNGKFASKDKGKGKSKAEKKKISNAIVIEKKAAVMFGKIQLLSKEEIENDSEDYA